MLTRTHKDPAHRRWLDLCWEQTRLSRPEQDFLTRSDPAAARLVRVYCLLPAGHSGRHLAGSLDPLSYRPDRLARWLAWRGRQPRQVVIAEVCAVTSGPYGLVAGQPDRCRLPAGHQTVHSDQYIPDVVWQDDPSAPGVVLAEDYSHAAAAPAPQEPTIGRLDGWLAHQLAGRYDRGDRLAGLLALLEHHVRMPFRTQMLGMPVAVDRLEQAGAAQIVAVVRRGKEEQRIDLDHLPLPDPAPAGAPLIAASRALLRS